MSLVQRSIGSLLVLADRPGLAFAIVFGLVVVGGALLIFWIIRRKAKY